MVKINQDRGICIFARKRYGKTTLMRAILSELRSKYLIVIYNTDYENFDDLKCNNLATLEPDRMRVADIDYLSGKIKKMRAGMCNFVLVIIDLDRFFEGVGHQTNMAKELRDLWGTGGHQRIMPIIESKAPKYIPPKVIDNNNLFYIGQFKDVDNQDRLRNYATREELSNLKSPEFIEVDDWTNQRRIVAVLDGKLKVIMELPELNAIGDAMLSREIESRKKSAKPKDDLEAAAALTRQLEKKGCIVTNGKEIDAAMDERHGKKSTSVVKKILKKNRQKRRKKRR